MALAFHWQLAQVLRLLCVYELVEMSYDRSTTVVRLAVRRCNSVWFTIQLARKTNKFANGKNLQKCLCLCTDHIKGRGKTVGPLCVCLYVCAFG